MITLKTFCTKYCCFGTPYFVTTTSKDYNDLNFLHKNILFGTPCFVITTSKEFNLRLHWFELEPLFRNNNGAKIEFDCLHIIWHFKAAFFYKKNPDLLYIRHSELDSPTLDMVYTALICIHYTLIAPGDDSMIFSNLNSTQIIILPWI